VRAWRARPPRRSCRSGGTGCGPAGSDARRPRRVGFRRSGLGVVFLCQHARLPEREHPRRTRGARYREICDSPWAISPQQPGPSVRGACQKGCYQNPWGHAGQEQPLRSPTCVDSRTKLVVSSPRCLLERKCAYRACSPTTLFGREYLSVNSIDNIACLSVPSLQEVHETTPVPPDYLPSDWRGRSNR